MSAIALREVSKSYGAQPVLRSMSLSLAHGTVTALVGASGSGKTTVLRLMAGLEVPDSGKVTMDERVVAGGGVLVPPWERGIGMVFQDLALWPHMRVRRQLSFVLPQLRRRDRNARIRALLELAEMSEKARRFPAQLSGGEQQRIAIVRALAPEPRILLLDEPFSSLDSRLREVFMRRLVTLKQAGVTMLVATHHDSDIQGLADTVVNLNALPTQDVRSEA